MPNTSKMVWPFPAQDQDPWYDEFVSLLAAMDSSGYATREDRNLLLTGGGNVSFTASTGAVVWAADIVIPSPVTGFVMTLPAGSATVPSGSALYVNATRAPTSNVTLACTVGSQIPNSDNALVLAIRVGAALFWMNGARLLDGDNRSLFESGGGGGGGMAIGSPVTSGTSGSVLWVDSSGNLAQDNANLFWDATNKAFGIGTNNPGEGYTVAPDISLGIRRDGHNFILVDNVTTGADSGIYIQTAAENLDACIYVDETDGQKLKFAVGTLGNHSARAANTKFAIDQSGNVLLPTFAGEAGSVLWLGANGAINVDFANLWWNAATAELNIGTNSASGNPLTVYCHNAGSSCINVRNTNVAGYSIIVFTDASNVQQSAFGYGNSSAVARVANHTYLYSPNSDIVITNASQNQATIGMTTGAAFLQLADGSSAPVSAAGCVNIIWNNGTGKVQISKSGAAYVDLI